MNASRPDAAGLLLVAAPMRLEARALRRILGGRRAGRYGVALLLAPFLPETAPLVLERLGLPDGLAKARLPDDAARFGQLAPGTATCKGAPLFPRRELEQ